MYSSLPSLTGVGTSGPCANDQATCVAATSPLPPGRIATIGLLRVGAMIRSPTIVGDAMMRYAPPRCGLSTSARQYSLPVAGSWPETTSPPVMISSARPFASIHAGVVYESGDSLIAGVG